MTNPNQQCSRLGIIGCGHLAGFVCEGLNTSDWGGQVCVSPYNIEKADTFKFRFGATIADSNQEVINQSDAVLVAVRPAQSETTLSGLNWTSIKGAPRRILISAMAGVTHATLNALAPSADIVRSMPISAATLHASPTTIYPAHETVAALFAHIGSVIPINTESAFEAATVNAAAYGWYFGLIDTMITANVVAGLDPVSAKRIAIDTITAATKVAWASEKTGEQLLTTLATPGGITAQGHAHLMNENAYDAWQEAFAQIAARLKSV